MAISTPAGRGGLGVIRLSGARATEVAEQVLRFRPAHTWNAWTAALAGLAGDDGPVVDHVVVTYFAKPRSYTAEDVVEISCHGSPVVLRYCVEQAVRAGARLAEPGEFTFRAFLNGRIDLPQAEAVRNLIDATTLYQARVAVQQLDGSVSRRISPVKAQLIELIALLEAGTDFAEDDIDVAPREEILERVDRILAGLSQLISSYSYGKLVYEGVNLAITGRPNVGKSSLFNRLLQQERAIVTEIPGTTRDLVSETTSIEGIPIKFVDTAGIRSSGDIVESLGVERSYQAIADADVVLVVLDLSQPATVDDRDLIERAGRSAQPLLVGNKCDLPRELELGEPLLCVSALTGEGLADLRSAIVQAAAPEGIPREDGFITSVRHEQLLRESQAALEEARLATEMSTPHDVLLVDLYSALRPIDAITGATTADDILNRIFSAFCIGK